MTTNAAKHLVSTKFSPPHIGTRHVLRTNLLAHLARMHHCRLTLITGAAGYGKTTLLAQWRQARLKAGAEVAWVSLTTEDKSYTAFCGALLEALRRQGIDVDSETLADDRALSTMDATVAAIVDGVAKFSRELYLILDDYHQVEAPLAHKMVQKLIDHGPANLHLVLASRGTPPLRLSRLRVMEQIVEIESVELPFDLAETCNFVEENLGADKINADELSVIHDLTGGWPSCLQLIVIMLKSRRRTRSFLRDLVWRSTDLQTYLTEEVVAHWPAEMMAFAEVLSLFRRFNAPMATAVTGNSMAGELIKRMEDENLLIHRIESEDRIAWYRFHPLFGEFLTARLECRGNDQVRELHRRAARWFAGNDCLTEAIRHASLGEDIDFATQVIERSAPATWSLDYLAPTLRLLEHLPDEVLFRHRRLLFLACLTVSLTARPERAKGWLARLETSDMTAHPDLANGLPLIRAAIAVQDDDTDRAVQLLEPLLDVPMENPFLRYVLLAALTTAYSIAGRYADIRRLFDTQPISPEDRGNDMALVAESAQITAHLQAGDVRESARQGEELLERSIREGGPRSIGANLCAAILGDAYYELDRIDEARAMISNRIGLLHSSVPDVIVRTNITRARLDLLQKGADTALDFLQQQFAQLQNQGQIRPAAHLLAEQIRVLLIKGQRNRAAELLVTLEDMAQHHRAERGARAELPAISALARSRMLSREDPESALAALQVVRDYAEQVDRGRLGVVADLLSADVLDNLKHHEEALNRLIRAVEDAHRLGLVRTLLDEGILTEKLLARLVQDRVLEEGPLRKYVGELLDKLVTPDSQNTVSPRPGRASPSGQQPVLTPRELEILSLVAQAMSSKRIALTLDITADTVKWNMRNIFAKLDVSNRYDAMIWARSHKLID